MSSEEERIPLSMEQLERTYHALKANGMKNRILDDTWKIIENLKEELRKAPRSLCTSRGMAFRSSRIRVGYEASEVARLLDCVTDRILSFERGELELSDGEMGLYEELLKRLEKG